MKNEISISTNILRAMTLFQSSDPQRSPVAQVWFQPSGQQAIMMATDGRIAAFYRLLAQPIEEAFGVDASSIAWPASYRTIRIRAIDKNAVALKSGNVKYTLPRSTGFPIKGVLDILPKTHYVDGVFDLGAGYLKLLDKADELLGVSDAHPIMIRHHADVLQKSIFLNDPNFYAVLMPVSPDSDHQKAVPSWIMDTIGVGSPRAAAEVL